MRRPKSIAAVIALAAPLFVTTAISAQEQAQSVDDQLLQAQQSWAMQSALAQIDQNKEAFVDSLMQNWTAVMDQRFYDVWSEIKPIAMAAPAWQLYGASRAGDFKTMVNVLRGRAGAGRFVDPLYQPQAQPLDLGDTAAGLIFTPIPPCRMVDTRFSAAGIVTTATPRDFDLTTTGYAKNQGGAISGCTGLPSFSHFGWAVNITVTGYTNIGGLKIYPFGGAEPATSVINYFPAAYAMANGANPAGCFGCVPADVTVKAFGADTHVIIDVMGYFEQAFDSTPATVTRVAGTLAAIAAGSRAFVDGGTCPAGTLLVGGEADHGGQDVAIGESRQDTALTNWTMWMINNDAVSRNVTIYSRCLDTPTRLP